MTNFIRNKWTKIYNQIITRSKGRGLNKRALSFVTERHHIIPRSLGGIDVNNIVLLTPKEHFVCHHLLTKMVNGQALFKMKHAWAQMIYCGTYTPTARQYNRARNIYLQEKNLRSDEWRSKISKSLTGRKRSPTVVAKMRARLTGRRLGPEHRLNIAKARKGKELSAQCRQARLQSLVKRYRIIFPDGKEQLITNLKEFCDKQGLNFSSANTNSKTLKPIRSGPMIGYNILKVD